MKKIALLLAVVAGLLISCGTQSNLARAEQQAQVTQQVVNAVESRQFTIAVDWMRPLGGMAQYVSSNYELKVDGDQVDSYLPYVGEAYRVPYGGGKGLNFQGKIEDYTMTKATTNRLVIEFNVTNEEDAYHYRIDLFTNGKAIIDVIARDRDAISFDGEMIF